MPLSMKLFIGQGFGHTVVHTCFCISAGCAHTALAHEYTSAVRVTGRDTQSQKIFETIEASFEI